MLNVPAKNGEIPKQTRKVQKKTKNRTPEEDERLAEEFAEKTKNRTPDEDERLAEEFMGLFVELGAMRNESPDSENVQAQIKKIQDYITEHLYTCTDEILAGLGKMYAGGGDFTENINKAGGQGTAEFAAKAIEIYVGR